MIKRAIRWFTQSYEQTTNMLMVNNKQFEQFIGEFSALFPDVVESDSTLVERTVKLIQFMYEGPPVQFQVQVPADKMTAEVIQKLANSDQPTDGEVRLVLSTSQFLHLFKAA